MLKTCMFVDENGLKGMLEFEVIRTEGSRPYGVCARLRQKEAIVDSAEAEGRFFTEGEAEAALNMLTKEQVTPCTLLDIL